MILRMSSLGSCIRAQVAERLGYRQLPVSDQMQSRYDRGNTHETDCLAAMRADGWIVDSEQLEVVITEADMLTGHLDGIASLDGGPRRVLEIKAPSTWASFRKAHLTADYSNGYMHRIATQISCYMVATGLECVMACLNDAGTVETFGIETPPHSRQEIINRVVTIEDWVARGELPPECSQADYPCPFVYLHDEDVVMEIDDPLLAEQLRQDVVYAEQIKTVTALRKQNRGGMTELGVGKYRVSGVPVTWYEQAGPSTWDEESLVARYGPEIREYKKPGKSSIRMKVGNDADTTTG